MLELGREFVSVHYRLACLNACLKFGLIGPSLHYLANAHDSILDDFALKYFEVDWEGYFIRLQFHFIVCFQQWVLNQVINCVSNVEKIVIGALLNRVMSSAFSFGFWFEKSSDKRPLRSDAITCLH